MNEQGGESFAKTFGCAKCRATPETDTDFDSLPYKNIKTLCDRSDSAFFISECRYCKQPFLEEYGDEGSSGWWQDDEPMWTYWMPLSSIELALLNKHGVTRSEIESIMHTLKFERSFLVNNSRKKSTFKWS